jgi:AAA domain
MRTIAVCNQKGGVGKSTISVLLADAATRAGARVLLIDLDPQANATEATRAGDVGGQTLADVLNDTRGASLRRAINPGSLGFDVAIRRAGPNARRACSATPSSSADANSPRAVAQPPVSTWNHAAFPPSELPMPGSASCQTSLASDWLSQATDITTRRRTPRLPRTPLAERTRAPHSSARYRSLVAGLETVRITRARTPTEPTFAHPRTSLPSEKERTVRGLPVRSAGRASRSSFRMC